MLIYSLEYRVKVKTKKETPTKKPLLSTNNQVATSYYWAVLQVVLFYFFNLTNLPCFSGSPSSSIMSSRSRYPYSSCRRCISSSVVCVCVWWDMTAEKEKRKQETASLKHKSHMLSPVSFLPVESNKWIITYTYGMALKMLLLLGPTTRLKLRFIYIWVVFFRETGSVLNKKTINYI